MNTPAIRSKTSMNGPSTSAPAYATVLAVHGPGLYRWCINRVGSGGAERVFQKTMLEALRRYDAIPEALSIDDWLMAIAARHARDRGT